MLSGFGFDDIIIWCFFLAKKKRNLEFWKKYVCGALKRKNGTWEMLSGFGFGGDSQWFWQKNANLKLKKNSYVGPLREKMRLEKCYPDPVTHLHKFKLKIKKLAPI